MTAAEIAALVAVIDTDGRYWWRSGGGGCYATHEYDEQSTDTYLLYASPNWVAQWNSDWQAAADALAEIAAQN